MQHLREVSCTTELVILWLVAKALICLNIKEHLFGLHKKYLINLTCQWNIFCTKAAQNSTAYKGWAAFIINFDVPWESGVWRVFVLNEAGDNGLKEYNSHPRKEKKKQT